MTHGHDLWMWPFYFPPSAHLLMRTSREAHVTEMLDTESPWVLRAEKKRHRLSWTVLFFPASAACFPFGTHISWWERRCRSSANPSCGATCALGGRLQPLSPQLPSSSPGGDPGPVIGRAVGCVNPGCPPEDTHILVCTLVW